MITSLISLTISPNTPQGVYCEIHPLFEELNLNISLAGRAGRAAPRDFLEGEAQGKSQGVALPAQGKYRPYLLFNLNLHSILNRTF